jgi:hypothetical protein
VLERWAGSGLMALTGRADGPPEAGPAGLLQLVADLVARLQDAADRLGARVDVDPAVLLAGRAGALGLRRRGRTSAGGACRLLPTADGWWAVSLARPSDTESVPALVALAGGGADRDADPGQLLATAALGTTAARLVDAGTLLGIPSAALPAGPPRPPAPELTRPLGAPCARAELAGALVVDLSSMWAGPLCARLLADGGARVVKVEFPQRLDGARRGPAAFYDWLHTGTASVLLDPATAAGRADLRRLLEAADVVLEASRPRALEQLGLSPDQLAHPDGQVWVSLTGHGRSSDRVAFGDDAAVAGGLVGGPAADPVFCGDAIADPLTGLAAATAALESLTRGGGQLVEVVMRDVAAAAAAASVVGPPAGEVTARGVSCPACGTTHPVVDLPALPRVAPAPPPGAHTRAVLGGVRARR